MLGVLMQRSWVILNAIALLLSFLYVFACQLPRLIGETRDSIHSKGGGSIRTLDASTTLCILHELPHPKIPTGTKQDHGHGLDLRGGAGGACGAELGVDAKNPLP
ncbi:hypothetical protein HN51_069212 [Arachis hypogaea]|nr:Protein DETOXIFICATION [Arachis hypogaea]